MLVMRTSLETCHVGDVSKCSAAARTLIEVDHCTCASRAQYIVYFIVLYCQESLADVYADACRNLPGIKSKKSKILATAEVTETSRASIAR